MNIEALVFNRWVIITIMYLTMSLFFSLCSYRLIQSLSDILAVNKIKLSKPRFVSASFLFMLSFFIIYVNVHFSGYISDMLGEILVSIVLGLFWAGLFLFGMSSLPIDTKQTQKYKIWLMTTLFAIGLFALRRCLVIMFKLTFTQF